MSIIENTTLFLPASMVVLGGISRRSIITMRSQLRTPEWGWE